MKKIAFVLFGILLMTANIFAKKVEGFYVTGKKDTVKTQFDIPWIITGEPDFEKIQWEIEYYDTKGDKQVLNPEWTSEVDFSFKEKSYRMVVVRNSLLLTGSKNNKTTLMYLKVLVDGPYLRLFQFYVVSTNPGNSSSVYNSSTVGSSTTNDKYIFLKKDGKQMRPKLFTFNKEVAAYLVEAPDLAKKVETKVLNVKDVEQIAKEYNTLAGKPVEVTKSVVDSAIVK
jgi:hypothetical protein